MNRSLNDGGTNCNLEDESCVISLANRGYFQNNRQMIANSWWPYVPRLLRAIRSMTHLEKLSLLECNLSLAEDLPLLFRSCHKIAELHVRLYDNEKLEMDKLENELRSGFQRLRLFEVVCYVYSWPVIVEIFS
jgi:hypothetical protein